MTAGWAKPLTEAATQVPTARRLILVFLVFIFIVISHSSQLVLTR